MQRRNNFIVGIILLGVIFLADIPLPWLTIENGNEVTTLTGWTGTSDPMGMVKMPIWWLLGLSAAASTVIGLNYARVTSIPFLLPLCTVLVTGGYYLWPLLTTGYNAAASYDAAARVSATADAGLFVALAATCMAICAAFFRPLPTRISQPDQPPQRAKATKPELRFRYPSRR